MFNGSGGVSLADIAAVTGNKNNDGDGFGGNNGWWVLIILFALFGWGRNGFGNGNGDNCGNNGGGETTVVTVPTPMYGCYGGGYGSSAVGFTDAAIQRGFDNQTVIQKLDGINNGLCSLGYDQLAQMNGINTNIMQTGYGITQAINADTVANMQNTNALSRQLADCCCENRAAIADIKYTLATDSCATNNNIHQTGDAIIQNQTQGFQMLNQTIKDGFCDLEKRSMQNTIDELRAKLNNCDRDSALQGTASYIINSVRPTPTPAWVVDNPWASCNCNSAFSGRSGCGCGNWNSSCCGN